MATLNEIEQLSKTFAAHRNELADVVGALTEAIEALKRKHLPVIKRRVEAAAEARDALKAALEDSAALFVKPRTQVMHGIKVGFQKAKGKIEWEDDDQVVKLIRKHFAEQFDVLVKTTEKPVKTALAQLTAQELKKLGIEIADTGDEVLIKDTTTDVDKLVDALLKDAAEGVEA